MSEGKPVICANCNQPMEPVELHNVPTPEIKDFIDIPGNELSDNWYWCPKCDLFKQETPPIKFSPDIKRLTKLLESFPSNL
jgi:hypothetical protein